MNQSHATIPTALSLTIPSQPQMFKIPPEHIPAVLEAYVTLRATAVNPSTKQPYIVSNESRRVSNTDSPISAGYTIISQSVFANWEDANFYDKECPAHKELKKVTGKYRTGDVLTLIYESEVGVVPVGKAKL
jgi:hypothetical protein